MQKGGGLSGSGQSQQGGGGYAQQKTGQIGGGAGYSQQGSGGSQQDYSSQQSEVSYATTTSTSGGRREGAAQTMGASAVSTTTTTIPLESIKVEVQVPRAKHEEYKRHVDEMLAAVLIRQVGRYSEEKDLQCAFELRTIPKPTNLGFNDVLIRVVRSQIDTFDTSFMQNRYGKACVVPCIPGFSGAGRVEETGSNPLIWRLKGKKVAFFAENGGAWAEFIVVDYARVIEFKEATGFEQIAGSFVNPLTAMEMLHLSAHEQCVLVTAGASQVMKQFIRVAKTNDVNTIAITRNHGECEQCRHTGALATLDTSQPGWEQELKQLVDRHGIKIAFDATAGPTGSAVFRALPKNSFFYSMGGLICLSA